MNYTEKRLAEFDKRTDMPERFEDIEQSLYGDEEYPEGKYELSLTKLESFLAESIHQALAEEREGVRGLIEKEKGYAVEQLKTETVGEVIDYLRGKRNLATDLLASLDTNLK